MKKRSVSAVLEGVKNIAVRDYPIPDIKDDDALLEMEVVGVCSSDVAAYVGKTVRLQKYFPLILGHEILGHVVEAGETFIARHGVKVGDRVLVECAFGCGWCRSCVSGNYVQCEKTCRYGLTMSAKNPPHLWGGYGEYLYLSPRAMVHKIDPSLPAEAAVNVSAVLGNAVRWLVHMGGASIGDTVVIEGPGPQGLASVIAAKEAGASKIIVTGMTKDADRLEMARSFGAQYTIDAEREDPVASVREITGGEMADIVIDNTGSGKGAVLALDLARQGGTFVMPGLYGTDKEVPLLLDKIVLKEIRILGAYTHNANSVVPAIKIAESRRYPLEKMVTHRYPLGKAGEALQAAAGMIPGEDVIKAIIDPKL